MGVKTLLSGKIYHGRHEITEVIIIFINNWDRDNIISLDYMKGSVEKTNLSHIT